MLERIILWLGAVIIACSAATHPIQLPREQIFTAIYDNRVWASSESLSGSGSDIATTKTVRMFLPMIIKLFDVKVLVDLGCGDFNWFKTLRLDIKKYIGIDVVPHVIASNRRQYAGRSRSFICLDAVAESIPKGDLVLCKDVLQHLSLQDSIQLIKNIKKSGSKYLLATTYLAVDSNNDIVTGDYSPINLQKPPFNFPEPLLFFRELSAAPAMSQLRQCLAVWAVDELPL